MANVRDVTWRFINLAPVTGSLAALEELFADTLKEFGVERFDCSHISAENGWLSSSVISERGLSDWNQFFYEQGYHQTDPCLTLPGHLSGGYTWSQVRAASPEQETLPVWGDARDADMCEGLIVPLRPRRPMGELVRLITSETHFDPDVIPLLQSISVVFASAVEACTIRKSEFTWSLNGDRALTEREVECLHWCARGKTNIEIGSILAISRHTVNTHVESAKRKLGVSTRAQAAALAHKLGLLSIA
jgi:LuxR family quorum-sensing system transcriptional regulator CciR